MVNPEKKKQRSEEENKTKLDFKKYEMCTPHGIVITGRFVGQKYRRQKNTLPLLRTAKECSISAKLLQASYFQCELLQASLTHNTFTQVIPDQTSRGNLRIVTKARHIPGVSQLVVAVSVKKGI